MSQLPADIGSCATEVLRRVKALSGTQNALWQLGQGNERLTTELLQLKAELMCITGEAAKMQSYVAAAKMCGLVEAPTRAKDLELHPLNHDRGEGTAMLPIDGKSRASGEREEAEN